MSYSSSVRMSIVDAIINNNSQLVFRLPSSAVLTSNIKLANVALTAPEGQTGAYNMVAGNGQSIKRIALMDGGIVLDQLTNANMYYGFKKFNESNRKNFSYNRQSVGNSLGYEYTNFEDNIRGASTGTNVLSDTTADTFKSCLYLKDWIAMLKSTDYLSTSLFKDLRVVVEYDLNIENCGHSTDLTDVTKVLPAVEPLLVIEEIVREDVRTQIEKSLGSFAWFSIESDVMPIQLPSAAPATDGATLVQSSSLSFRGFNNKYVRRIMMVNTPQTSSAASPNVGVVGGSFASQVIGAGAIGSTAGLQEKLNVVLNGGLLLPRPIEKQNQKLAMLVDTFGEVNAPMGTANTGAFGGGQVLSGHHNRDGRTCYTGLNISSRIQSLKVDYTRTLQFNATRTAAFGGGIRANLDMFNCPLLVTMFGEVRKSIVVQPDGSYNLTYMY